MAQQEIVIDPGMTLDRYELLILATQEANTAERAMNVLLMGQAVLDLDVVDHLALKTAHSVLKKVCSNTRTNAREYRKVAIRNMKEKECLPARKPARKAQPRKGR